MFISHTLSLYTSPIKMDVGSDLCPLRDLSVTQTTFISRLSVHPGDIVAIFYMWHWHLRRCFLRAKYHIFGASLSVDDLSCFPFKEKHFRSLCAAGNWLIVSGLYMQATLCPYDKHLQGSGFFNLCACVPLKEPSLPSSWFYLSVAPFFFFFSCSWYHLPRLCVCVSMLTRFVCVCLCVS